MKRLKSNANLARGKYSKHAHVEHSGIGTRLLSAPEIEQMQVHVDRVRFGEAAQPIRLKVPA
jgi:hypothetical protein